MPRPSDGAGKFARKPPKADRYPVRHVNVVAVFDPGPGVWYTESSSVHGLRIEAPTPIALIRRLPATLIDLLACEDKANDPLASIRLSVRFFKSPAG